MTVELLTKVTFRYNEVEDRILMSALLQSGEPVAFWLTQRLCGRIIPALTAHLERSVPRSSLIVDKGLLLSCQQREAEWQHKHSEPVRTTVMSPLVLPEKVSLLCSAQSATMLFPLTDGAEAQLPMSFQELRQLLAILYRQFQYAGWPQEIWPKWLIKTESGRN